MVENDKEHVDGVKDDEAHAESAAEQQTNGDDMHKAEDGDDTHKDEDEVTDNGDTSADPAPVAAAAPAPAPAPVPEPAEPEVQNPEKPVEEANEQKAEEPERNTSTETMENSTTNSVQCMHLNSQVRRQVATQDCHTLNKDCCADWHFNVTLVCVYISESIVVVRVYR